MKSARNRAIEVLREAREMLAARLTHLVLEQTEEILADARGESYMNEIESLYEAVGMKLAHISQMLANLPAEEAPAQTQTVCGQHRTEDAFTVAMGSAPAAEAMVQETTLALPAAAPVAAPALPAPRTGDQAKMRATGVALQAFAAQIQAGDLLAAGRTLATLFDVEEPRAVACAATFAQRVRSEAAFFRKVMELRSALYSPDPQRALWLLLDCFGLTRGESAEIVRHLQRRRRVGPG
jgi:DNA-directed RNA polymerase specialized sigma24 family protein